jgi:spermidine/putrescine-binding protein
MSPEFAGPYPLAFAESGELIGMPQRYGPFSFVVNTDKISRKTAEDQGWALFLDPGDEGTLRRPDLRQLERDPSVHHRRREPVQERG